jgi:hypothetical protein
VRASLHITNGDAVVYLFKKAGILGSHVAWKDGLYEGPVPSGGTLEATSRVRIEYLTARGHGNPIKIIHDFQRRDAMLRKAASFEEIVLWFEHDLYDQLQLLQILTALQELDLEPGLISIVQVDQYLATMSADEIGPLFAKRRPVTAATSRSAARGWARFTSSSPSDLFAAAQEDAIGLPHLRASMQRLCEEYPSMRDGLSRSQRQALSAVARGPARIEELFTRAQAREEACFLSDGAFARVIDQLREGSSPLVEGNAGALVPTALGRRVLAGDADWLESHEIDRWIGGVHLAAGNDVRWDDDASRFVWCSAFEERPP